jgi:hypothetical protein
MTLREYLNAKLGTLEERMAKMSANERSDFERIARIRASILVAESRESGRRDGNN